LQAWWLKTYNQKPITAKKQMSSMSTKARFSNLLLGETTCTIYETVGSTESTIKGKSKEDPSGGIRLVWNFPIVKTCTFKLCLADIIEGLEGNITDN
jgi:hypothetical protein